MCKLVGGVPNYTIPESIFEPRCEKTGFLHICENKDVDQLRRNFTDITIPLLPNSEI